MMSVGTGGFSGSSAATGPVAGFDPLLDFRKKMARRIKDHPFAKDYKSKRKESKKMKESVENPRPSPTCSLPRSCCCDRGRMFLRLRSAGRSSADW